MDFETFFDLNADLSGSTEELTAIEGDYLPSREVHGATGTIES
jgi:hypothetical protein